jgi:hypothetical protein
MKAYQSVQAKLQALNGNWATRQKQNKYLKKLRRVCYKVKGKVVPVHVMKAYGRGRSSAPLILKLASK